jgi:hypothetical protein
MSATLLYVLLATATLGAPSTIVLNASKDPNVCEKIKAQIIQAHDTDRVYSCETLVAPDGKL